MEKWKTIKDYPKYQVSNLGRVKSFMKSEEGQIIKGGIDSDGYHIVLLYRKVDGKRERYTAKVHRLVAQAFIENPDNLPQVNHKNGNKLDNRVENLEWATPSQNVQHAFDIGLKSVNHGKKIARLDPNTEEVLKVYDTIQSVEEDGFSRCKARGCARGEYGRKLHKGFKWKFV